MAIIGEPKRDSRTRHAGPGRPTKLDRAKVQQLAAQGVSQIDIARMQGVSDSAVSRYLQSLKPLKQDIDVYVANHADLLSLSQAKKHAVETMIIDRWISDPDKYLFSQDVRLQKEIIHTMQGGRYYDHQSERLERGLATTIIDPGAVAADLADLSAKKEVLIAALKSLSKG